MLDGIMLWLSQWGLLIPAACVLLTKDRKAILTALISFLITYGVSDVLKTIVARPRPFIAGGAQLIGSLPGDEWSFPSKHASISFSLAVSTFLNRRVLGWIAFISAVLISYSRVYLGVHYWSDIFAGALLGSVITFGVDRVLRHLESRNSKRKRK